MYVVLCWQELGYVYEELPVSHEISEQRQSRDGASWKQSLSCTASGTESRPDTEPLGDRLASSPAVRTHYSRPHDGERVGTDAVAPNPHGNRLLFGDAFRALAWLGHAARRPQQGGRGGASLVASCSCVRLPNQRSEKSRQAWTRMGVELDVRWFAPCGCEGLCCCASRGMDPRPSFLHSSQSATRVTTGSTSVD